MAALKILRPGLLTTVQDCGRWGHQSQGVPVSGAMDVYSHRLANNIIANPPHAATLEVTLMGPQVEFVEAAVFAVSGAEFRLTLNDSAVPMNQPIEAGPGSCLRFGDRMRGARAYLAVLGGIDVPSVLGSRSTHVVSRMGGYEGRALRAGDVVKTGPETRSGVFFGDTLRKRLPISFPEGGARLRVIAGALIHLLEGRSFTLSPRSDRMGYRLESVHQRTAVSSAELISTAVPMGAVQIPPTGQPILLMADRATSGGYALAGTVITADLPAAGQLAPGDWIEFEACSLQDADAALRALEDSLAGSAA